MLVKEHASPPPFRPFSAASSRLIEVPLERRTVCASQVVLLAEIDDLGSIKLAAPFTCPAVLFDLWFRCELVCDGLSPRIINVLIIFLSLCLQAQM